MKRREFMMLGSGVAALAWSRPSFAQQGAGIKRLGFLIGQAERDADAQRRFGAFVERLRELGWKDGDTLHIEQRWVAGDPELRQRYVAELVALAPDAIATSGTPQLNELSRATRTIPVVFMSVSDPVGLAFVASLAHPGGNITGFANFEPAMAGKWLELLKETDPRIVRVVLLHNPRIAPIGASILRLLEAAAQHFGVSVTSAPVQDSADIERAIPAAAAEGNSGLIIGPDDFTGAYENRERITALAARYRLPAIYPLTVFAANGGLLVYGIDLLDQARQAAVYVSRVLKGEKPADLPVQLPTKFEMIINLKTAKALGLTIPATLLAQANEVIE